MIHLFSSIRTAEIFLVVIAYDFFFVSHNPVPPLHSDCFVTVVNSLKVTGI